MGGRSPSRLVCTLPSISGGTDLCACFVAGDPTSPAWAGEIQRPGLGMAVDIFDEAGAPAGIDERGELVCRQPFPSMPLGFWNDDDGAKYRAAYFDKTPGVWSHGDFASWTAHGGMIVLGRSDTTLNPGGVRIGTAEIYRRVEQIDSVVESLVFGQDWDDDSRIVLLVRLAPGVALDDDLVAEIKHNDPRGLYAAPRAGAGARRRRPASNALGEARRTGGHRRGERSRGAQTRRHSRTPRRSA